MDALLERESLQSTGIGEGVAIPHEKLETVQAQCAAFVIVPEGLAFDAIDGENVNPIFGVVGPRKALVEHQGARANLGFLRNRPLRERLSAAPSGASAYELLVAEESRP